MTLEPLYKWLANYNFNNLVSAHDTDDPQSCALNAAFWLGWPWTARAGLLGARCYIRRHRWSRLRRKRAHCFASLNSWKQYLRVACSNRCFPSPRLDNCGNRRRSVAWQLGTRCCEVVSSHHRQATEARWKWKSFVWCCLERVKFEIWKYYRPL